MFVFVHRKMHAVGIHSALAIKRQRKRRDEQKRAKERRYSIQSSESGDTQHSPHGSTRRKHRHHHSTAAGNGMLDTKVCYLRSYRIAYIFLFFMHSKHCNMLFYIILLIKLVVSLQCYLFCLLCVFYFVILIYFSMNIKPNNLCIWLLVFII